MQDQRLQEPSVRHDSPLYDRGGMLARFLLEDLPADDLATIESKDQVEIEEQAFGRAWQSCDIPRPDLPWFMGRMRHRGTGLLGRATPSAMVLRVGGA